MIHGYPIPGKRKARLVCEAFAAGCKGTTVTDNMLRDGDAFFYGVDFSVEHIWRAILHDHSRDFYLIDNSYFDDTRQQYFRITKNMLQHPGTGMSDGKRLEALNLEHCKPWQTDGKHVIVCEQSASFMELPVGYKGSWLDDTLRELRQLTSLEVRVRKWSRDKSWALNPLKLELAGAAALVTWSSAAAITAVMGGVPIVVQGQSAAAPMAGTLADLPHLPMLPRYNWLSVLADNQFTLEEMRSGHAWEALNAKT